MIVLNIINSVIDTFIEKTIDKKRYIFINLYLKNEEIYLVIKDNTGEKQYINKNKILDDKGLFMSKLIIEKYQNGTISFKDVTYTYKEIDCKGIKYTITLA